MIIFVTSSLMILFLLLIWKIRHSIYNSDPLRNFSKTATPLLRHGFDLAFMNREQLFAYTRACAEKFKKSYRRSLFFVTTYSIVRAKDAEKILGSSKHIDKSDIYKIIHPFLNTGLLTSGGEKWHTRRRMLTPAFHFNILKEFCEIFKEEGDKLIELIKTKCGQTVNIIPISTQFTLNTICESAMGVKLSDLGNDGIIYRNNIYKIGKFMVHRLIQPWLHFDFIYTLFGYQKEFQRLLKSAHDFTQTIIDKRRKEFKSNHYMTMIKDENENIYMSSKKKRYAMMDTLLQAQSEGLIDDEGIREETDTFTFEGHDTGSACMSFTLLLLAHHPEVQDKLFEEIQEVSYRKNDLTLEDFNKMNYMERVLKESLRIYPPVHFISRKFNEDVTIDEITYKKNSIIEIYIYDIHRDPAYFPDPEKFDPDRFLPENSYERNNFAFVAFSAGMRNCIGQRFAMLELKVMLTKIIQNFKIHPITKRQDLIFISDLVLRTKNPIEMKFEQRKI
ncbi:hypothetical protein PVAND_004716 [Polypedilum vanderplanki]|uniref:Cytochrome P450 n=1 Tax=Polypedilum vanderplanki TaxID=319348 RepID=A0A9J6BZX6_POLVA|nr:hypothetical protein PVAND_004716 [Polypedilum vanderplanki]